VGLCRITCSLFLYEQQFVALTDNDYFDECNSPNGDSSSTQSRQSPAKLLQYATRGKLALAAERSESPSSDQLGKMASGKMKGKNHLTCKCKWAEYHIKGIMPEGRMNKITDLWETKVLCLFGLTNVHY
jgi:hypothetical protein